MLVSPEQPPDRGRPAGAWTFPSTVADKDRVLNAMLGFLAAEGLITDDDQFWCRLVLDEALVNAVKHGNACDAGRNVAAACFRLDAGWGVMITDEGRGFAEEDVPSLDDEASLLLDHGRGVNLMRHYMDEVRYFSGGRTLWMYKSLNTPA